MKIRINNIFINKKTKEKNSNKIKNVKKENNMVSSRYRDLKFKKVYDVRDIKYEESETKKQNGSNEAIKRRKGFAQNKDENIKEQPKFKIYYNNLVRNKNKLSKGYYLLLLGMIGLGAGSVTLASKTYNLFKQEDYQVYSSIYDFESIEINDENKEVSSVVNQSNETSNKDTIVELEEKEVSEVSKNTTTVSNNTVNKESTKPKVQIKPLEFSKPINGEILKVFSNDKVIYSKTLELWKTHDGIDIKAEQGEYVKSIERGTVEKVYEDSFYGITIVIDHGQGYKSSYSNLDKDTLVNEKQTIVKGQKIGKVGNTAIGEIKDESHLHFMLFKDSLSQDPTSIFK